MRAFVVFAAVAASGVAHAGLANVALNAEVSAVAGTPQGSPLSTLTDGVFLPRGTQWQTGTVWWNSSGVVLQIDLGQVHNLVGAIVQADDNDAYRLLYRDMDTGDFRPVWEVANYDGFGNGMQTRPNPGDDTMIALFPWMYTTDAVQIVATSGDGAYSVSEVQLFIPAPGAAALLAVAGLGSTRRRTR